MTPITSPQLVALTLYALEGGTHVVDTEDIAVRAHEIAPGRFAWRKYPDQINLELVRVALSDAVKPENGSLVNGTGRTGWSLTREGQRWAEENASRLLSDDFGRSRTERRAGSIDERRWQRERARAVSTQAWVQWEAERNDSAITAEAAAELFRIDRYVQGRAREMKVNRLRDLFRDDGELAPFIEAAASVVLKEE